MCVCVCVLNIILKQWLDFRAKINCSWFGKSQNIPRVLMEMLVCTDGVRGGSSSAGRCDNACCNVTAVFLLSTLHSALYYCNYASALLCSDSRQHAQCGFSWQNNKNGLVGIFSLESLLRVLFGVSTPVLICRNGSQPVKPAPIMSHNIKQCSVMFCNALQHPIMFLQCSAMSCNTL